MPIQGFKCKEPYTGLHMLGLARELWRRVQGLPEATDARMVAGTHLGNALVSQGSYAEAAKLHRTIYDVRAEHLSRSSFFKKKSSFLRYFLRVLLNCAHFHIVHDVMHTDVKVQVRAFGQQSLVTLATATTLGHTLSASGNHEQAEAMFRATLTSLHEAYGQT